MKTIRVAGRILALLAAIAIGFFVFTQWEDWKANSLAKEISAEVRNGMPEKAVVNMVETKGGRIRHSNRDEPGFDRLIVRTSGWDLICRIEVTEKDGVVVSELGPTCLY